MGDEPRPRIMAASCRDRARNCVSFFIFAFVHIGAIAIVVKVLTRAELSSDHVSKALQTRQPKAVLNQRRLFYFLSKAASLEPSSPVNQSCSLIKR